MKSCLYTDDTGVMAASIDILRTEMALSGIMKLLAIVINN